MVSGTLPLDLFCCEIGTRVLLSLVGIPANTDQQTPGPAKTKRERQNESQANPEITVGHIVPLETYCMQLNFEKSVKDATLSGLEATPVPRYGVRIRLRACLQARSDQRRFSGSRAAPHHVVEATLHDQRTRKIDR